MDTIFCQRVPRYPGAIGLDKQGVEKCPRWKASLMEKFPYAYFQTNPPTHPHRLQPGLVLSIWRAVPFGEVELHEQASNTRWGSCWMVKGCWVAKFVAVTVGYQHQYSVLVVLANCCSVFAVPHISTVQFARAQQRYTLQNN